MSLSSISRWFAGRGGRPGARRVPTTRLGLERLECREVPALSGGLYNGVLTINSDAAGDNISLTQTGNTVRIEGYTNTWSASAISQIRINAGGGDDTVRVAVSQQLAATLVADGGIGRDVLYTTAQPTSWTGFEAGYLIAPPAGTGPTPSQGVQVVWTGSTGPYTVSYYRRDDGPTGGELDGIYNTRQAAENAVARLQRWAAQINNGGYWDVVRITVEGTGTGSPGGSGTSSYATVFANVMRDIANAYDRFVAWRNQIVSQINNVVAQYRPWYNLYQNAIRVRNAVDQLLNNMSMSVQDVYNRYGRQPNYVWANPSVLTFAARQVRQQADYARNYMNQNLPGDIWAPVRNSANSALRILYDAADTMDNLAGAIRRARGG
jgi:hypothetical protein